MKLLLLILSFYLLLLPCMPCSDTKECVEPSQTERIQASTHQDHQHENEACNPFCSCACCGHIFTPTVQPAKLVVSKPPTAVRQPFFYKNVSLSSTFFGNIWQPPKLS